MILRTSIIMISLCCMLAEPLHGQDSTNINTGRLILIGSAAVATIAAIHIYQRDAWWQGDREPFRFENDWEYALNIDKFGHTFGAFSESKLAGNILRWSGFSKQASTFYGSMTGLAYQTYVEIEDGYHKAYGFSPGDEFSNIIGASIPLAQEAFPFFSNFSLKYSYYPSNQYLTDLKTQTFRVFIDDYEGSTFWITMDPHFLMSKELSAAIPRWLGVSLGFAVHNLNENGEGDRLYYLTLDYNFSKIETESSFLKALFGAMDFFHFPAPGVGIEDGKVKVGIFYTYHTQLTL